MKGWRNKFMVTRLKLYAEAIVSTALNGGVAFPYRIAPVRS